MPASETALVAQGHFWWAHLGFGVLLAVLLFYRLMKKESESKFRLREADRSQEQNTPKTNSESPHLLLEGFRTDGAPHEILGVASTATEKEIRRAYKQLMRRVHPDKIGRPGSPEWKSAQSIAQAVNEARDAMIRDLRDR